jgi:Sucrase/ferredoxin-like
LGNLKIIISTGKSDWERDIGDSKNSLAAAMIEIISKAPPVQYGHLSPGVKDTQHSSTGLFLASDSSRTSILNGSHKTLCHESDHETVLVFPDFKVVTEVRRSAQGAQELWDSAVNPSIGRSAAYLKKNELKTWIIPYSCVILLC